MSVEQPVRIVSGGQTGVDRAALDAAIERGVPHGGWCPAGRRAEDGVIPARYALRELPGAGYEERTRQNVLDAGGTLVLSFGTPRGGTGFTVRCAREADRPCLVLDLEHLGDAEAARRAREFVTAHRIRTLNVAGPRASQEPRARERARAVVGALIDGLLPGG